MGTLVNVQHGNNPSDFLDYLQRFPKTKFLCQEAEANTAPNADETKRKQEMIQTITDRVYTEAQAWVEDTSTKTFGYSQLFTALIETQKANFVYRNLMKNFEKLGTRDFEKGKYASSEEMYRFFADKYANGNRVLTIKRTSKREIDHFATLSSIYVKGRSDVSYQNCDLPTTLSLSPNTRKLDLSHSRVSDDILLELSQQNLTHLELNYSGLKKQPEALPASLKNLSMRGSELTKLSAFKDPNGNVIELESLDISYMSQLKEIEDNFWESVDGCQITISPDMKITVPSKHRNISVSFYAAQENRYAIPCPLTVDTKGTVLFPTEAFSKKDPIMPSLSHQSHTKSEKKSPFQFWKWAGITAVLSALGYLIYRMWPRARA